MGNKQSPNQSDISDQIGNFNSSVFSEQGMTQCSSIDTNFSHPNHVSIFQQSHETLNMLRNLPQEQFQQLQQYAQDNLQIPVTFRWIYGGNSVKLAGTFNKWSFIPMNKVGDDFSVTIQLLRGRYQYKFIVDDKNWMCAKDQPTEYDENKNNVNNVIEVQGVNLSEILSQNSMQSFTQTSQAEQLSQ